MDDAAASPPPQAPMIEAPAGTEWPAHPMPDEPSLGDTIRECFANLAKGNEVQTESLYATWFEGTSCYQLTRCIDLTEPNNGATTTIIIVQGLLYASLFSTLLAALLAVLGKQWLMHYDEAGSRGTLAERGLQRQRKHDGLQRWKFTLVMEMFPLLLQLAPLLFSAALSVYLSTINHSISIIVITFTSVGALAYISLLVSAAVYPDSPFQTPLAKWSIGHLDDYLEVSTTAVKISSIATVLA
ncbi:hypothetical protein C8J57DRAFT_1725249 [Mycena rebaudengoi]|nr:hypothetical protein C8J57DRAFT_1725249 [Mycena rebaudengoi]